MVNNNLLLNYRDKKVLVTGDTGFKGAWLSLWLSELGAEVCGYALPPERGNDLFNLIELDKTIKHVNGDIRDNEHLFRTFKQFKPDYVFHLAAQSLVLLSYDEPKLTFDTNVGGSVNVLEACRRLPTVKALVYVTSDKCYSNKEWIWGYRENDCLGGSDPYSASKAAAEIVFNSYLESFYSHKDDFGAASVRAGNVIGGGDRSINRIIPDAIAALEADKPIQIRNPQAVRPWQHVLEPLYGYLMLAISLSDNPKLYSGAWNFGPEKKSNQTVRNLVEKVIYYWGSGEVETDGTYNNKLHETTLLYLNWDKAYHKLGWSPVWDFETTVKKAVQWYKEVGEGASPLELSRGQINDYKSELELFNTNC